MKLAEIFPFWFNYLFSEKVIFTDSVFLLNKKEALAKEWQPFSEFGCIFSAQGLGFGVGQAQGPGLGPQ